MVGGQYCSDPPSLNCWVFYCSYCYPFKNHGVVHHGSAFSNYNLSFRFFLDCIPIFVYIAFSLLNTDYTLHLFFARLIF